MRTLPVLLMCLSTACAVETTDTVSQASEEGEEEEESNVTPRDVATIRAATAKYHSVERAIADGYAPILGADCLSEEPGAPPAGIFYISLDYLLDSELNATTPEALIYSPEPGGLKLVGVEYIVLFGFEGDEEPEIFDTHLHAEESMGLYGLHVWAWRHNPDGMTAELNASVCD